MYYTLLTPHLFFSFFSFRFCFVMMSRLFSCKCHFKMKWLVLFFTFVADALKIENVIFEEYAMYGATVTMVCEYKVGESEYVDSIKWYKDNREFYRIVPHTSIEKDKVVTFNRKGINLDLQRSGVSSTEPPHDM